MPKRMAKRNGNGHANGNGERKPNGQFAKGVSGNPAMQFPKGMTGQEFHGLANTEPSGRRGVVPEMVRQASLLSFYQRIPVLESIADGQPQPVTIVPSTGKARAVEVKVRPDIRERRAAVEALGKFGLPQRIEGNLMLDTVDACLRRMAAEEEAEAQGQ